LKSFKRNQFFILQLIEQQTQSKNKISSQNNNGRIQSIKQYTQSIAEPHKHNNKYNWLKP